MKPDTTIRLGQLIADPLNPQFPLATGPLPLDSDDISNGIPIENYECTISGERGIRGEIGLVIFNFLNFYISSSRQTQSTKVYKIEKVGPMLLNPSDHYVQRSMQQPAVIQYLQHHRRSVYMVVGLQVAHTATVVHTGGKSTKFGGKIGPTGLALAGSPIDAKLGGSTSTKDNVTQSYTVIGDFVFAYRLRKCYYHRESGVARMSNKFVRAQLYNNDDDTIQEIEESMEIETSAATESMVIVPDNLSGVDLDARALKIPREAVCKAMDEEECELILLSNLPKRS